MSRRPDSRISLLLDLLDEAFDHKAWHGPNLRGSLRLVDPSLASLRPDPNRKCIWEQVLHATYWKYAIRRRLLGEKRGSFPLKGSNWFLRPDPNIHRDDWNEAWKADLALLDSIHESLRNAIAEFPAEKLDTVVQGSQWTFAKTICGAALHDVYHAGQIQLLKKLASSV